MKKNFLFGVVCLSLFGCASISRPIPSLEDLKKEAALARSNERANTKLMIETLARRAVKRGDGHLDLLFLSGVGKTEHSASVF